MKSIAIICIALLVFGGCDLFNVRNAEIPSESRSNFQGATTPDQVIPNLTNSLKDKNVVNYLACFSDTSYVFSPSSEAISLFASNWDKNSEKNYFNSLMSISNIRADSQVILKISNLDSIPQVNNIIYTVSYNLTVPFIDPSFPSSYRGDLKFSMRVDSRHIWSIYWWQDFKSTNYPSWSELKGRLGN